MVMPVHPMPAFKFGAFDTDKLQLDLQDYFTCSANLTGIPALAVPCGFTKDKFITNDPGVNRGRNFVFPVDNIMESIHDWNGGDVQGGRKVVLVIE